MQSGEVKVRKATGPIAVAIASLIAAVVAAVYSALLGFGVNERCDSLASGSSDCDGLNWMALLHAGTQVVLVIAAGISGVSVWRANGGGRRSLLIAAVAFVYAGLVATAVVVYTAAAWDFANSRGS